MTVRQWAIRPGELRPLDRTGRLLFGARLAMRVERWCPPGLGPTWDTEAASVVAVALAANPAADVAWRAASVRSAGAAASNAMAGTDGPLARCMGHAAVVLSLVVDASARDEPSALTDDLLRAAKAAASIPATLAHAGRAAGLGVEEVVPPFWDLLRADIVAVAGGWRRVERSDDPVVATRRIASLWPGGRPPWARAGRAERSVMVQAGVEAGVRRELARRAVRSS